RPVRYCSKRRSFALCHVSCSCNEHTRCCAENGHKQSLAALLRTATFITRKLSHDFPRTEIERFFNCHPFRSFLVSSRVLSGKEYLLTRMRLHLERPLAKTAYFRARHDADTHEERLQ